MGELLFSRTTTETIIEPNYSPTLSNELWVYITTTFLLLVLVALLLLIIKRHHCKRSRYNDISHGAGIYYKHVWCDL